MDTVLHIKIIKTFIEQRDNRESPTTTVQAIYADVNKKSGHEHYHNLN